MLCCPKTTLLSFPGAFLIFSFFFSYKLYFQQTARFMTRQPENAMLVDCLRSLRAKIRAKSMFTNLLFFDAFTYVLIHTDPCMTRSKSLM
jgi:hypothetical protein